MTRAVLIVVGRRARAIPFRARGPTLSRIRPRRGSSVDLGRHACATPPPLRDGGGGGASTTWSRAPLAPWRTMALGGKGTAPVTSLLARSP